MGRAWRCVVRASGVKGACDGVEREVVKGVKSEVRPSFSLPNI